jgi:hypothetical protein
MITVTPYLLSPGVIPGLRKSSLTKGVLDFLRTRDPGPIIYSEGIHHSDHFICRVFYQKRNKVSCPSDISCLSWVPGLRNRKNFPALPGAQTVSKPGMTPGGNRKDVSC